MMSNFRIGYILSLVVVCFCLTISVTLQAWPQQISQIKNKAVLKIPESLQIFWNHLQHLREDPSIRSLASFKRSAACREDPFRNVYRYAASTLRGEKGAARAFVLKHDASLGCINRMGMGAWDRMFAAYYRDLCARKPSVSRAGIRATMNAGLMVADYLLYTGYSEIQRAIHDNLACFQNALREDLNEIFFCRHLDGSVLEFRSPQIEYRAVTTVANREGELGFGFCPLCEHAHHNFEGICGRGFSERLACLRGAEATQGGTVRNEQGASNSPSAGDDSPSNDRLRSGMGRPKGEEERDYLNGMTEGELKTLACGFGKSGELAGNILGSGATVPPSGRCFSSDARALMASDSDKNFVVGDEGSIGTCMTRHVVQQGIQEAVRFQPEDQRMMRDSCQWGNTTSDFAETFDIRRERETVSYDYVRAEKVFGQDVQFRSYVSIDGDGNYTTNISARTMGPNGQLIDIPATWASNRIVSLNGVGSVSLGDTNESGRLGDFNSDVVMIRVRKTLSHEGGGGGTVTRCTADTDACRAANAQADAVEDEIRRRQAQRRNQQPQQPSKPKQPGSAGNPGTEGADHCSAEGRMAEALVNCAEGEEAGKTQQRTGRFGPRGTPPGWQTYPQDEGGGTQGFGGLLENLSCGQTSQPASANDDSGAIDPCPPGEPWCLGLQDSRGLHQGEYFRRSQQGVIDPAPEGGGQRGGSGSGGGCIPSSRGGRPADSNCPPRGPGGDPE